MNLGINLAAPAGYEPNQFANRMLTADHRIKVMAGAATIGADGWPVGSGIVTFNTYLDPETTPASYKLIVLEGTVTTIDVNSGAGNGGHVYGKATPDGVIRFTANGIKGGSVPMILTITGTGRTRWALVRVDEEAVWRADPFAHSTWIDKFEGFTEVRFMNWMGTNDNVGSSYINPDPSRPGAFEGKVPLSVMVAFAKRTGIHPWFCIPVRAFDDDVRSIVRQVEDCIRAGLRPTFELSNEVWNAAYSAHTHAVAQETALIQAGKLPADAKPQGYKWYGYRAAQVSKVIQSMGWKVGIDFHMTIGCAPQLPALAPLVWAGVAAAGGSNKDFSRWMTAFYTHGDVAADLKKTIAMVNAGDLGLDAAFENIMHATISSVDWFVGIIAQHKAIANANGLELVGYEGNISLYTIPTFAESALVGLNVTKAEVLAFFERIAADPRAGQIMTAVLTVLEAGGMSVAHPFDDQTKWSEKGTWGLYGTPAWDALVAWIAGHRLTSVSLSLDDRVTLLEKRLQAAGIA